MSQRSVIQPSPLERQVLKLALLHNAIDDMLGVARHMGMQVAVDNLKFSHDIVVRLLAVKLEELEAIKEADALANAELAFRAVKTEAGSGLAEVKLENEPEQRQVEGKNKKVAGLGHFLQKSLQDPVEQARVALKMRSNGGQVAGRLGLGDVIVQDLDKKAQMQSRSEREKERKQAVEGLQDELKQRQDEGPQFAVPLVRFMADNPITSQDERAREALARRIKVGKASPVLTGLGTLWCDHLKKKTDSSVLTTQEVGPELPRSLKL